MQFDKFFTKYQAQLFPYRHATFGVAFRLLLDRKHEFIVETGTMRKPEIDHHGDGGSTLMMGDFCRNFGGHIWTCDIDPEGIENCRRHTKDYDDLITYVVDDSLSFLESYPNQIDFLYLDSLGGVGYEAEEAAALHQLEEFKRAEDKLHENSIIVVDDTLIVEGQIQREAKGFYSVPYMVEKGWNIFHTGKKMHQAVLVRQDYRLV